MSWGKNIRISVFGESHGPAVGMVLEGVRPGLRLDMEEIDARMRRRAPGGAYATQRRETDAVQILAGVYNGYTQGTPIAAIIANKDSRSGDYARILNTPRPGHADLGAYLKYGGFADMRGGGHFSGRLTAPLVLAGAIAMQALKREGVQIAGRLASAGGVEDGPVAHDADTVKRLDEKEFPVLGEQAEKKIRQAIEAAREQGDSLGGVAEAFALGVRKGLGGPLFEGAESAIAALLFAVPGVKGVEIGGGFMLSALRGSQANDPIAVGEDGPALQSNHCGGIQGGVTVGTPVAVRAAFKPTPSIGREQRTVDLEKKEDVTISIRGRHDPCIALRGVPVVAACLALALLDLYAEG